MLKVLLFSISFFQVDRVATDSIPQTSILFIKNHDSYLQVPKFIYQYQQGFFCDFEDKINKNNKMQLNIGVGGE